MMGLRNTDTIDVIVESPHTQGYDLIVFDPGDVANEIERFNLLLEKLTAYANYVASGELFKAYPRAKDHETRFVVVCQVPANEAMLRIEAIKPRHQPDLLFRVVFTTQDEYIPPGRVR